MQRKKHISFCLDRSKTGIETETEAECRRRVYNKTKELLSLASSPFLLSRSFHSEAMRTEGGGIRGERGGERGRQRGGGDASTTIVKQMGRETELLLHIKRQGRWT